MIQSVPRPILLLTAAVSMAGALLAVLQGWPAWAIGTVVLLPWLPVLTSEVVWTYRHYGWLALFYLLVVTQGGHVVEHMVQMIQLHLLGLRGPAARGVFGMLDIEWVHFLWNTWVLVAVTVLLWRYRRNRWLWATLALAAWHETEHIVMMVTYLGRGVSGSPGLLARGGLLAGGIPVTRPDLHFLYNVIETTPLAIAFVVQVREVYDRWLRRALPRVPEPVLAEATRSLQLSRFPAGATIIRQGDPADAFYVIVRGEVTISRLVGETPVEIATLRPGEYFGEIGLLREMRRTATVMARGPVELLILDRKGFARLVAASQEAREDLTDVATRRMAGTVS
jgi:hypothetical protein